MWPHLHNLAHGFLWSVKTSHLLQLWCRVLLWWLMSSIPSTTSIQDYGSRPRISRNRQTFGQHGKKVFSFKWRLFNVILLCFWNHELCVYFLYLYICYNMPHFPLLDTKAWIHTSSQYLQHHVSSFWMKNLCKQQLLRLKKVFVSRWQICRCGWTASISPFELRSRWETQQSTGFSKLS